jgi:hypothetical protein
MSRKLFGLSLYLIHVLISYFLIPVLTFQAPFSDFICRYEKAVKELSRLYVRHGDLKDKIFAASAGGVSCWFHFVIFVFVPECTCLTSSAPKNSYFESVLIMPVQRPPRYVMLLQVCSD